MKSFAREFLSDAERVTHDLEHRERIQTALRKYDVARDCRESAFQDWQSARQTAAEVKWDAVNHLDGHLIDFARKIESRGTHVHWASNADDAREVIVDIIRSRNARSIIKSKVMTGEEIHLNGALEKAGFEVVESDLGEYIVQLRGEAPYHFVFPAMHLNRDEISKLFECKLGSAPTESVEELTSIARRVLREKFISADIGISGANFAIAETGMISITENEGNARLTCALPKVHIALLGIEKVLPRMRDLALFLPMLATAGSGQLLTCYNSLYSGPRQLDEHDGPEEFHVILLDNNRTQLLSDPEQRDALHCIRCGACLNICPIYRNVGGHTYGTTYQGPIGSVITPHLRGLQDWSHLSNASSLCGACTQTCPVKIDLHHHLLRNRRNAIEETYNWPKWLLFKCFSLLMNRPWLYRLFSTLSRWIQPLHGVVKTSDIDPIRGWTSSREFPKIAPQTFKEFWRNRT